jgi:cell division protein FtsI/penicillin-binding protein 2
MIGGVLRAGGRAALVVACLGLFGALLVWLVGGFVGTLSQSRAWVRQPDFTETTRTTGDLFNAAVRKGVIWIDAAGPSVRQQPCEALFKRDLVVARPQPFDAESQRLLDKLCNLAAGRQIANEIQGWNASFLIAGVRDDRRAAGDCADGREPEGQVIQPGCRPAEWLARMNVAGMGADLPLTTRPGAAPPPRDFADFAAGSSRPMTDWALFGPLANPADQVRMIGTIPARSRRLVVDAILEPSRIVIGRDSAAIAPARRDSLTVRLGGFSVLAERICAEDDHDSCAEAMAASAPGGWRFTITGAGRTAETPIQIEGTPVRAIPATVQAVTTDEEQGRIRMWRSPHIEVTCERAAPVPSAQPASRRQPRPPPTPAELSCGADWRETVRRSGGGVRTAGVIFADGQPALGADGYPSALVDQLGLTPLLGYGPSDLGSLASALGNARTRETLRLTIDPQLQKLANEAVFEHMNARLGRGQRPRRPGPLQDSAVEQEPQDVGDGRAALVLLDAGDEPGAVLAMAGWPAFRAGMNAWDLQALSVGRPTESPLAGHAWRSGDVHAMPGSTFKLVTGIAGIMALGERPELADIIAGRAAPGEQQARLRIGGAELNVDGTAIRNFGGAAFTNAVLPPGRGASGCPVARLGGQIGVCEALIKSSNLWFGGLALGFDGPRVIRQATEIGRTGTWLARATEHYFPIAVPGATGAQLAAAARELDMMRGLAPGAIRLVAEPVELAVEDKRNGRRIDLVTNSYGQGVRASPLAMATIYGSVGAGRIIRPRLVHPVSDAAEAKPATEGAPLFPGLPAGQAPVWTEMLRAGLHGVANSPYGTAAGIMGSVAPELRTRVYGKTGTADTVTGMNSAWFAGWIEDIAGRRRVAFACWVSHTRDTGGRACGALIARLTPRLAAVRGRP